MKNKTEIYGNINNDNKIRQITKIKDLPVRFNYEEDNIVIEAYIFGIDMIVYENATALLTLKLSDQTGNIIARVGVPSISLSEVLEIVKLGTSWRIYGECNNKKYDGINVIKMERISRNFLPEADEEPKKYFFFENLDLDIVKLRKKDELKDKINLLDY